MRIRMRKGARFMLGPPRPSDPRRRGWMGQLRRGWQNRSATERGESEGDVDRFVEARVTFRTPEIGRYLERHPFHGALTLVRSRTGTRYGRRRLTSEARAHER